MSASAVPAPQAIVQPSVPWPVLRNRLAIAVRPINGTDDGVAAVNNGTMVATVAQQAAMIGEMGVETAAKVVKGEAVVILEAMKMENALVAPCDGVIQAIGFKSGDTVPKGATLCVI